MSRPHPLSQERHLAWKSCNTIRHGLRFFYQVTLERPATEFYLPCAKEPSKPPQILSHEQLVRLFTVTTNCKHRALLMTTYAAGLRASEVTRLRVTDIDSARMCIRVEQGKGRKDRYVPARPTPAGAGARLLARRAPTPVAVSRHPDQPALEPRCRLAGLCQGARQGRDHQGRWVSFAASICKAIHSGQNRSLTSPKSLTAMTRFADVRHGGRSSVLYGVGVGRFRAV
jgi:integrase